MNVLLGWAIRYLLPYPDPLRRRRMRKAAKALITFSTWPGDEAESAHVAQLVLLRLLRLQREAHRSAAVRNFEATVLLTRAATETCIAGMYWLGCDDATTRLGGANAKSVARMMQFLSRTDPLLPAAVDDLVRLIAEPLDLPKPWNMADAVTRRTDQPLATELYQNVYVPLSTLFEHPGGLTLLRHVGSAGQPKERPARFWSRRASLHTIDLRTAQLALVLTRVMVSTSGTPGAVVVEDPKLLRMSLRTTPLSDRMLETVPSTEFEPSDG